MYNYLATLRLHATSEIGATLTVGPKRRVVLKERILYPKGGLNKEEIKRVLSPLRQYWGCDDPSKLQGRERDPDRPLMGFMMFRIAAKKLLSEAGMLREMAVED